MLEYFDARAATYGAKSESGLWKMAREREFRAIGSMLSLRPGLRLIDIGCGAGFYGARLRQEHLIEVLGVDSSPRMVRSAETQIPVLLSPVQDIPDCGLFDRAVAAGVLEFVENPAAVFERCRDLVKPGGRLAILVPAAGAGGLAYRWFHEWQNCQVFIRNPGVYRELAERSGFRCFESRMCTPISRAIGFMRSRS